MPEVFPIFPVPKVFPILDSAILPPAGRESFLRDLAHSLADAGATILEYRNKPGTDAEVLSDALILRAAMPNTTLILDDRVDIALAANFNGVHVDSGDLPPHIARALFTQAKPNARAIIGTSASSEAELHTALEVIKNGSADYIAFGPIFPTTTKQTSAPTIGIEGVRNFRALAGPGIILVAAAGITLATAPAILAAGATSVAVSAAIFRPSDSASNPAAELSRWLTVLA